ncbi:unnamed protein product, partial [Iphiclides podalirius]
MTRDSLAARLLGTGADSGMSRLCGPLKRPDYNVIVLRREECRVRGSSAVGASKFKRHAFPQASTALTLI